MSTPPSARTEMLIRRPPATVYSAFADPAVTARFWFSDGSAVLETGRSVRWNWRMFGFGQDIRVLAADSPRRIAIEWPGRGDGVVNTVEWTFEARADGHALVRVAETGFVDSGPALVDNVADAAASHGLVLAGAKAWLEHGLRLNLVADRFPDGPPGAGA